MIESDYILNLSNNLKLLDESLYWLKRSFNICNKIGIKEKYDEDEYDALETLTARFGRSVDIIIYKIFKGIDRVEFEYEGSLIDVINRAEKRRLINTANEIRLLKELRNQIVHEYINENLIKLYILVMQYTDKVFEISENIKQYCKSHFKI